MIRQVVFYKHHFFEFYEQQTEKVQERIDYVLELIANVERVPVSYLKHLEGTDGLFEVRIQSGSNIFRIFCCFDEGRLVVLFNGFQKKTEKTPKQELEKAERLKQEYFNDKRK